LLHPPTPRTAQEKDIEGTISGETGSYSRAEMRDTRQPWAGGDYKQRASEYDAIYYRLKVHAVEMTQQLSRPVDVQEAARAMAEAQHICQNPGQTLYVFMRECVAFRSRHEAQQRAAAAAGGEGA
jgi:hypothetical protein